MTSLATLAGSSSSSSRAFRACDPCRRRKIKCDGLESESGICTSCVMSSATCTYGEFQLPANRDTNSYVRLLEARIATVKEHLRERCPGLDLADVHGLMEVPTQDWTAADILSRHITQDFYAAASPIYCPEDSHDLSDDEGQDTGQVSKLHQGPLITFPSYLGKNGNANLAQQVMHLKYKGVKPDHRFSRLQEGWASQRTEFWELPPWELDLRRKNQPSGENYTFPDPDLLPRLVDQYFTHMNVLLPLLHRPSFIRSVETRLHLRNNDFARVLLLVCAIGSRGIDDPRLLLPGSNAHSAGWKWFIQTQNFDLPMISPPSLHEVQAHCLSIMYIGGTSYPQSTWVLTATGLLVMQNIGAHRGKLYGRTPCIAEELWKRAFWVLIFFDRYTSMGIGRSCAVQDEDYDLAAPVDCDDEFWEHDDPAQAFVQPAEKPSYVACFVHIIKLHRVLALALRNLFSVNIGRDTTGSQGLNLEEKTTAELEVAMKAWLENVPKHLRWNPSQHNATFFLQSAFLYVIYYRVQLTVYQRFLVPNNDRHPLFEPALAKSAHASRLCSEVLDALVVRETFPIYMMHFVAYHCAATLILVNSIRKRLTHDHQETVEDKEAIHHCMHFLKWSYPRWGLAGSLWLQLKALLDEDTERFPDGPIPALPSEGHVSFAP